jgi:hypothetical protein
MPWRSSNIMELEEARPQKSTLGFWVLVFERAFGSDTLVFANHHHFDESAPGLAAALEEVAKATRAGLVARIVHVKPPRPR